MRDTFIGVFGGIVLIVSVLCFGLVRLTFGDPSSKGAARTAVNAAAAQLEVETLHVERWLATQAADEAANDAFDAATPESQSSRTSSPNAPSPPAVTSPTSSPPASTSSTTRASSSAVTTASCRAAISSARSTRISCER